MNKLSQNVYRAAQVREMDRLAIEQHGVPGYTLMSRAGEAACRILRSRWPQATRMLVICGAGNNAGDGYVIARLARDEAMRVTTVALVSPDKLKGDAATAFKAFRAAGGTVVEWADELPDEADVIVDAMLGTGLERPLSGQFLDVVCRVNAAKTPVLAVDIPTGLHADSGEPMGGAIRAAATVSFVGLKRGLYCGVAPDYTGQICFDDLGVGALLPDDVTAEGRLADASIVRDSLPPRPRVMHKGSAGHVLVVGGGSGMPGAVRLAAEASLRSGAGLVTVATCADSLLPALAGRPELMGVATGTGEELSALIDRADVIAVGPGLGQSEWSRGMLDAVLDCDKPLIVDADALNLLAGSGTRRGNWVLTPHPGEAGRLLGVSTRKVQSDRFSAVARLVERYGGIVVLKGAGTLVGKAEELPWICDRGNPGMAAPGMGDLLTGVIAGIAAQTGDLWNASRAGVWVHATAGDGAAASGERGMIASDLLPWIVRQVNP